MHRIGLVGAGRIGIIHVMNAAFHPAAQLVAITDRNADAAADLARRTGAAVLGIREIVTAEDVEVILIYSPTDTHADLIEQSVAHGKAICCEKPIDLSIARAARAVAVAEAANVPLMIASSVASTRISTPSRGV